MTPAFEHFGSAASGGNIPETASASEIRLAGKPVSPDHVDSLADKFGKWAEAGVANPVSLIGTFGEAKVQLIGPGGRDPNEVPRELTEGRVKYEPQRDMFGAPS